MTSYAALLRAVNVGGTGKLAMADLRRLCAEAGFRAPRTYIASGNAVFEADVAPAAVKRALEAALLGHAGAPVAVHVRTGEELADVLARNPFADRAHNRTVAIFLDAAAPPDVLERVSGRRDEAITVSGREIFVHYGEGMAQSRLKIPAAAEGTARNMNTVAKLAEWTAAPT